MSGYVWDFSFLVEYKSLLLTGLGYTLLYTLICVLLGMLVGVLAACARLSGTRWLSAPVRAYVEVFRCTPVLVQLVWFYYALPVLTGVEISAMTAAVLCLSLYGGAFYAEIFRGGIISMERGQGDAARALGMRGYQVMWWIILPQAFKRMVPPLVNQSIMQLKNTSLLSVLALPDLLYQGQVIAHDNYRPLEVYTVIAVIYFIVLLPATMLARRLEQRTG
ncbi:amino acid ABC transporter permease [Pseudomonas sp. nanlin1]|uniref:amino acid ABC transporter permease n=1 Tax=Pseudomonas sp. nanlin1 TaxID=3040605 RepID=UPI003890EA3A